MTAEEWGETRQERRDRKRKAQREQIPKHGASLRQNIVDAALRLARKRVHGPAGQGRTGRKRR